jgi:hypothetical protein
MNEKRFLLLTRGLCIIVVCITLASKTPPKPKSKQSALPAITATPTPSVLASKSEKAMVVKRALQHPRTLHIRIYDIGENQKEVLASEVWIKGDNTRMDTKKMDRDMREYTKEPIVYIKNNSGLYKYELGKKILCIKNDDSLNSTLQNNSLLVEGDSRKIFEGGHGNFCNYIFFYEWVSETFDINRVKSHSNYDTAKKIIYQGREALEIISKFGPRLSHTRRIEFLHPTQQDKKHLEAWIENSQNEPFMRMDVNLDEEVSDTIFDTSDANSTNSISI